LVSGNNKINIIYIMNDRNILWHLIYQILESLCQRQSANPLGISPIQIDFMISDTPTAVLTLGQAWGGHQIKIESVCTNNLGQAQNNNMSRMTGMNGNFQIPIMSNTCRLDISVTIGSTIISNIFNIYDLELIWRSYDGSGNNVTNPTLGKANENLYRKALSDYADGQSALAVRGPNNPSPRVISNNLCKSTGSVPNSLNLTDMIWGWGQFLDHEIDLTPNDSGEFANIVTPTVVDDPEEDYPGRTIEFQRSRYQNGNSPSVREQPNVISSFIDGTNVYGSDVTRAYALRRLDGSGKLRTGLADNGETILPYNDLGLGNAGPGGPPESFFLAGDIRANENVLLTSLHVLFVREHNRLCDQIVSEHPGWAGQDEIVYQHARRIVSGLMQQITYSEFLPSLLGPETLGVYSGYQNSENPEISTEFSTAGYRLGHSMLSSNLKVGDSGTLALRDAFFTPSYIQVIHGHDRVEYSG
jgi:hypothetical protein